MTVAGDQQRVLLLLGHAANIRNCVDIFRHLEQESGGSSGLDIFSIAIAWGTKVILQIFLHREEETLIIYQF